MAAVFGLLLAVLSLAGLYLVAHRAVFAVVAIVMAVVCFVLSVVSGAKKPSPDASVEEDVASGNDPGKPKTTPSLLIAENVLLIAAFVFLALGLLMGQKHWMQIGLEWSMLAGIVLACKRAQDSFKSAVPTAGMAPRVRLVGVFVAGIVIVALAFPAMLDSFLLDGSLLKQRTVETVNVTNAVRQDPVAWETDYTLTQDISYESEFQNGFFDLYTPAGKAKSRPVFIYVHGGGFCSGDKNAWNPDSMGAGFVHLCKTMLDRGYAVVVPNYELTPDGEYCGDPTPVYQMEELAIYLQSNDAALGLDMSQVVLGGGSAGGYIAAEFAAWQVSRVSNAQGVEEGTDWLYSDFTGTPSLDPTNIKALYLGCALLDPKRFSNTGDVFTDYKFHQMAIAYFGDDYADAPRGDETSNSIIDLATADFPATYIVDGNTATFTDQARDLANRLEALGVRHAECIFDSSYGAKVPHGFDAGTDNAETQQAIDGFIEFLR